MKLGSYEEQKIGVGSYTLYPLFFTSDLPIFAGSEPEAVH
jgi:hypothetical protein